MKTLFAWAALVAACFAAPAWASDCGGTITTGGTAQNALTANPGRGHAVIENPVSATEDLYVAIDANATTTGAGDFADLAPGGSADVPTQARISVIAATTAHRFICTEWN